MGHMNGYVEESLGKKPEDYDVPGITGEIDKLYALASQHTDMDTKEAFAKVMPALQQIVQTMQQNKPEPRQHSLNKHERRGHQSLELIKYALCMKTNHRRTKNRKKRSFA
jgi:hypothetical protein